MLQVAEVLAVPGCTEGLAALLGRMGYRPLTVEVAWLVTYLTASAEPEVTRLLANSLKGSLQRCLKEVCGQVGCIVLANLVP